MSEPQKYGRAKAAARRYFAAWLGLVAVCFQASSNHNS
jgi:hypothetical protein